MRGPWIAALICLAPATQACGGEEVFFELDVRNFMAGDNCAVPLGITDWVLTVRQGGIEQCARGPCARPNGQPFECVDGAVTPPVEPGKDLVITLGLYGPDMPPLACDQRVFPNGVEQGDRIVLEVACDSDSLMRCPPRVPPDCPPQMP